MLESADLHTETFTNSQGWKVVRVTHIPTGTIAERERTKELASSVPAQTECIAELRHRVHGTSGAGADVIAPPTSVPSPALPVSRAEFDALVARVAALEQHRRV